MKGWAKDTGMVWKLNPSSKNLDKIFSKIDHAHGLAMGPDNLVYIGTRGTIFRFDPNIDNPQKEVVINDLPVEGKHPLTHFIFDQNEDLIVNAGAPSDQCLDDNKKPQFPCPESEGNNPEAVLRKYTKNSNYKTYQVLARGLRKSMALAIHPETQQLFQGENGMDFKALETPMEEINLISEGKHYGWPYCYENGLLNPKYKRTFFNRNLPKNCDNFTSPVAHLPAHSAPLDMLFYQGEMFPELNGKLIVYLHGYRETGHRIVSLDLSLEGLPLEETRKELVTNWTAESGLTPKGAPVGMTIDTSGNIWVVEDKNKTVLIFSKGNASTADTDTTRPQEVKLNSDQKREFEKLTTETFSQSCIGCHDWFEGNSQDAVNQPVADKVIDLSDISNSPLIKRISGTEMGPLMPIGGSRLKTSEVNKIREFLDSLKL